MEKWNYFSLVNSLLSKASGFIKRMVMKVLFVTPTNTLILLEHYHNKKFSRLKLVFIVVIVTSFSFLMESCKDVVTNPFSSTGNVICYEKLLDNHWEIITNNVAGNSPQNISNYSEDDEYPKWSPDGKYIVYSRSQPLGGLLIIVYDIETGTSTEISDGGGADLTPLWTPDNKVIIGYSNFGSKYHGTYLMDPDGGDRKKILDTTTTIYFYNDSYNFLYVLEYAKVYRSNIDTTVNEFLFDIRQQINQQIVIQEFNPITEELLISPTDTEGKRTIATYSIITRSTNILLTAEQDYTFFQMKYSMDFSTIAFIEYSSNDEYLSIFENDQKKRLVRIPATSPPTYFSHVPVEFSPDGKYIAFSKKIYHSNGSIWGSFSFPLFIVNTNNGKVHQLEDNAHGPSWNPQP